ncbi:MAG: hypothetical protein ABIO99_10875, partial [Candidatus Limnocylindria bacterium]
AVLLLVAVAIGAGTAVYNAGVTAGLVEAAQQAAAAGDPVTVVPGGYYGWGGPYAHGFFGFGFGFIFWILGIFLVIGLVRGAFGRGRWGGPGGPRGPGGRGERVEEWHRELHRREGDEGSQRAAGA